MKLKNGLLRRKNKMTKAFKRNSGRKTDEIRPIEAKVGIVPNADGSAMFKSGNTVAIAAVYGPKKMHPQHFLKQLNLFVREV